MKIPKAEIQWTQYQKEDGTPTHIMTSNEPRTLYYLYEIKNNDYVKLGKAKSPIELEEKFLNHSKTKSKKGATKKNV